MNNISLIYFWLFTIYWFVFPKEFCLWPKGSKFESSDKLKRVLTFLTANCDFMSQTFQSLLYLRAPFLLRQAKHHIYFSFGELEKMKWKQRLWKMIVHYLARPTAEQTRNNFCWENHDEVCWLAFLQINNRWLFAIIGRSFGNATKDHLSSCNCQDVSDTRIVLYLDIFENKNFVVD
jgi:hypothetical protein